MIWSYNDVLNIYKRPVYEENKCIRYFHNMAKTYNTYFLSINININTINKITFRFKIHSYLIKYSILYNIRKFIFTIKYFNRYRKYYFKKKHIPIV